MTRVLMTEDDATGYVTDAALDAVEDLGYDPEVSIPGLIQAVCVLASRTSDPEQALNEACDLLVLP